jgi:CO dehydrogenase maturation factor
LLRHLLTQRDEVVVVDLVAGIEHLGRGTAAHVDTMLIVSEPSLKSLETARRVFTLAKEAGIEDVRAVGNKILEATDAACVRRFFAKHAIPLLGLIPYDEVIRQGDADGYVPMDPGGTHSVGVQRIREMGAVLLGETSP